MSDTSPRQMTPFFVLWSGQALSLIGSNAVQFAVIWWITAQTGSASVLAAATLLGILPQIVLGPFIGAWVDRWNRKRIMLLADAGVAAVSAVLALLFLFESIALWHVMAALLLRSIGGAFHSTAMLASTTLMVPKQHLTRIQGLNQALQGGQLIISAPLGALLYSAMSMAGVMSVDIVTAMIAIAPLIFIRVPQPAADGETSAEKSTWGSVVAGVRYLRAREGHVTLLAMSALINMCMIPAFALLPLLVLELDGGVAKLGGMNSLFGIGSIAGGILLGVWGGFRKGVHTMLAGLLGIGIATLVLASSPTFAVALIGIGTMGILIPLANGPIHAILQATVAPEFQGRVFTLYASVCTAMTPFGLLVAAPISDLLGVRIWYAAGGIICLLMGTLGFFLPSLMKLEGNQTAAPSQASRTESLPTARTA